MANKIQYIYICFYIRDSIFTLIYIKLIEKYWNHNFIEIHGLIGCFWISMHLTFMTP